MTILQVQNLYSGYQQPLLHVDFTLNEGEHLVLYGPNGSGKSTFMKTLAGLLPPLSGAVLYDGRSVHKTKSLAAAIFYLPEKVELPEFLTPREYVTLMAEFYRTRPDAQRLQAGLELLGLTALAQSPIKICSMGQKRRVQLLAAYVLQRPFTLLDDPLIGIDHSGLDGFSRFMQDLCQHGLVVITARRTYPGLQSRDVTPLRVMDEVGRSTPTMP